MAVQKDSNKSLSPLITQAAERHWARLAEVWSEGLANLTPAQQQELKNVLGLSDYIAVQLTRSPEWINTLFADDLQDGTLEQLLLSTHPLPMLVLGKIAAHWCGSVLLLVLVSPLLALQFDLSASATGVLLLTLLIGSPVLSLVGAIGAALTLGLRGGGVLMSLLTLPLVIPVLIFGAGAVEAHTAGLGVGGHFSLLGALLLLSLFAAPLVTSAALRISME